MFACQADLSSFDLKECLEEKRRAKDVMTSSGNLSSVIAGLQDQLNGQKEIVKKYEGKIKKREAEVRNLLNFQPVFYVEPSYSTHSSLCTLWKLFSSL